MNGYTVARIGAKAASQYIRANHYTHGCHNGPSPCYGLYDEGALIGVLLFATPCSENVRASIMGPEHKNGVVELHRLHIMDGTPTNTESWMIGQCLRRVAIDRPQTRAVISFADATEGHKGTIYRATNGIFYGMSGTATFYRDADGRLRHPRQNGVNITAPMALALGWTAERRAGKYRYLWIVGDRRQQRATRALLRVSPEKYPDENA